MAASMASKRSVLEQLSRDELLAFLDRVGLVVADRRKKTLLIDLLASSRRAHLADHLATFSRLRLQQLCRDLGTDDSGRDKASLVDRLKDRKTEGARTRAAE